jgi:hypothetical protein
MEQTRPKFVFDKYTYLLLLLTVVLCFADYWIWKIFFVNRDFLVYQRIGIGPFRYLIIVVAINTFLAIFSYFKEKEIAYLFLSANILCGLLILALEIIYRNSY